MTTATTTKTTAARLLLHLRKWIEPAIDNTITQVEGLGKWTCAQFDQRDMEIQRLQARIEALEQRQAQAMNYVGIWEAGASYQPGDVVTHSGVLWFAHSATSDRPGTTESWQMMMKSR